jgi:hypothetical protein
MKTIFTNEEKKELARLMTASRGTGKTTLIFNRINEIMDIPIRMSFNAEMIILDNEELSKQKK